MGNQIRRPPNTRVLGGIIPQPQSDGQATPPSSSNVNPLGTGQSTVAAGALVGGDKGVKIHSNSIYKLTEEQKQEWLEGLPETPIDAPHQDKEQRKNAFNFDPQKYIVESILYYQQSAKLDAIAQSMLDDRLKKGSPKNQQQYREAVPELEQYTHLREREDVLVHRIRVIARAQAQHGFVNVSVALEIELAHDREQLKVLREEIKQLTKQLETKLREVNYADYAQVDKETQAANSAEIKKLVGEIAHRLQLVRIYEANLAYYEERFKADAPVRIMHEVSLATKELDSIHKELTVLEKTLAEKWSLTPDFLQHISTLEEREIDKFVKHVIYTYLNPR